MKKTNLKTTAMGFVLLFVAVLVSTVLIKGTSEKTNPKNEVVEVQPKAVTFIKENCASEVPSDVYARLREAGLVDFAGFQATTAQN